MEISDDADLSQFRREVEDWIGQHTPVGLVELFDWRARADTPGAVGRDFSEEDQARAQESPIFVEWERAWLDVNLVCASWPKQYGGRGWDETRMALLDEICYAARVPRIDRHSSESMVGPSIILHGSDEQKAYFLPRIKFQEKIATARGSPNRMRGLISRRFALKVELKEKTS